MQAKHNELLSGMNDREEIRVENAADVLDNLQLHMDREVVMRKLDSYSALLHDVNAGTSTTGSWNVRICLECEEDIPARRLQVLPWAARCVPCQQKVDRRAVKAADATWPVDEE